MTIKLIICGLIIFVCGIIAGGNAVRNSVSGTIHVDNEDTHSFIFQIQFYKNPKKYDWSDEKYITLLVDNDSELHEKYQSQKIQVP